ncbi:uncharacterized protein LOC132809049 isoform X5 [Hemiscyllium ocellatum]|uniref:uncharacterized protein LOC132809049 isoform X5 n=1 Tax=Hemiscyllium ocellatum TaxID=170820 RepID=UPI0029662B15|nr:uncharacterized protein LOC132809049 isoform X5 [Hemiscyllium ocellatum]
MLPLYQWALLAAVASVLDRVGSSTDLHLFHVQCSCTYRNARVTQLAWQDGYDGVTALFYDFAAGRFVATEPFAQAEVDRRNQDADYTSSVPRRIEGLCGKIKQTARISNFTGESLEHAWTITSETALTIIGAVLGLLGLSFALVTTILYCRLFHRKGCSRVCVNPTAKFTKREGTLCRSNLCNSSIRSDSSASSNTSTTSADDLTKTHA